MMNGKLSKNSSHFNHELSNLKSKTPNESATWLDSQDLATLGRDELTRVKTTWVHAGATISKLWGDMGWRVFSCPTEIQRFPKRWSFLLGETTICLNRFMDILSLIF